MLPLLKRERGSFSSMNKVSQTVLSQPLFSAGFVLAGTLLISSACGITGLLILCAAIIVCCLILAVFSLFGKRSTAAALITGTAAIALVLAVSGRFSLLHTAPFAGYSAEAEGRIQAVTQSDTSTGYLVSVSGGELPEGITLMLYTSPGPEFSLGEQIAFQAEISENPPSRSQLARGAKLMGYAAQESIHLIGEAETVNRLISRGQSYIRYTFARYFPASAADFLTALFLGETNEMPRSMQQAFSVLGISHILSVSGTHITMLCGIFLAIFRRIFGKGKIAFLLCFAVSAAFVVFTGNGSAAWRVLLMTGCSMTAFLCRRDYSPRSALGAAMLLICLFRPETAYGAGFWLSVMASLAVFSAGPAWTGRILHRLPFRNKPVRAVISSFCTTAAATIFCLPIYFCFFGSLSWNILLPNLVLFAVMPAILCCGILALLPGVGILAVPFGRLLEKLLELLSQFSEYSGFLPLGLRWVQVWAVLCLIALLVVRLMDAKPAYRRLTASFCILLLAVGTAGQVFLDSQTVCVSLVSTESGGSVVLSQNGRAVVIGCGGDNQIGEKTASFLRSQGIQHLDALILPEASKRMMSGAASLLQEMNAACVICDQQNNWFQTISDRSDALFYPLRELHGSLWEDGELILSEARGEMEIAVRLNGYSILFQPQALTPPESGWDLVIFYDEFKEKNGNSSAGYAIIEMAQPVPDEWFAGSPLLGEYYSAQQQFFLR